MNETSTDQPGDTILGVLGQQILPIYTQICFGFPVADAQSYSRIVESLEDALMKIYASFPWLAGRVVNEGASRSSTGVFKIEPQSENCRLFVKDLRQDLSFPSLEVLRLEGFPLEVLDENVIAPRRTHIDAAQESSPEVLLLQANSIHGGLLLTFIGHHQAMDGLGQDQIIRLFSKACRNEDFTEEEQSMCNLTDSGPIPLLNESSELLSNLDYQIINNLSSSSRSDSQSRSDCNWAYFSFSQSSLDVLKSIAARTSQAKFISTDDALSAFIWKAVTSARLARLSASTPSTFARAVEVRRMLGVSPIHPGFIQNMTYNTFSFQELVSMPLGVLASHLRSEVAPETTTLVQDTCALATFLAHTPDKSCVSFAAKINGTSDIFFSSWAKMRSYEYDFGPDLGRAEVVRRTKSHATEGLMYLMPRSPNGEIGLVICLSKEDMAALRKNDEFSRFAEYVG